MTTGQVEILLVEDNPGDVDLIIEALKDWKILNRLNVVNDGVEAMNYLHCRGKYILASRPDLILLDLNLPRKDGREVLHEIKSDRFLKSIPVVILSTSDSDIDMVKTYRLGANCYITKPVGIENFIRVIQTLGDFWFKIVSLPNTEIYSQYREKLADRMQNKIVLPVSRDCIHVLIVDDNQGDSEFVKEILSDLTEPCFDAYTVGTLSGAMELLEKRHFDIVLLDLGLPDSQGIETFTRLSTAFSGISIVVMTVLDDLDTALTAIRGGAGDFVQKGEFDSRLLAKVIQYAIERKRVNNEKEILFLREQAAKDDAENAVFARDEFLGIASHELKTPLTALRMQSQFLSQMIEKNDVTLLEKNRRLFRIFDNQVERLSKLVENLLDITRITAGKMTLEYDKVDLKELVQDLLERYQPQLEAARCRTSLTGELALVGNWDRYRIEQVVTNLLANAMKYGAGKPIEIRVEQVDKYARLTIEDHGIGIKNDDLSRLFGRFERMVGQEEFTGLGLGLYIVRKIVDGHQGKVAVESVLGKGSKFIVDLPLHQFCVSQLLRSCKKSASTPSNSA